MKRIFDLKDLGVAFSLSNLWFITFWKQLIYSTDKHYFDFALPVLEYLAVFIDVLLLTFIFLSLMKFADYFSNIWLKRAFQLAFLVLGLLAFGALSSEIIKWLSPKTITFVNIPLPIIVLSLCVVFAVKQKLKLSATTENLKLVGLFLLPFSLLIIMQVFWTALTFDHKNLLPQSIEGDFSVNPTSPLSKRVVWIIFDEIDYSALVTAKQNNIYLPDIERLINQSFTAQNALSPNDYTFKSIPSLLTGKIVRSVSHIAANDLMLNPTDNSEPFTLRQSSSIFKEVKTLGGESGIVGFFHPYSRIFKGQVAYAFWRGKPQCATLVELKDCSVNVFINSLLSVPFMTRFFPSLWIADVAFNHESREWQLERNRFLTDKADELISNPELNLLFFHFSIPHAPYIGRTDLDGKETYFNSLEVANDTLKRLRETLEKSGQWDDTILIVSSDHWWRFKEQKDFNYLPEEAQKKALNDIRIPFIIKFAAQKERKDYEPSFNTVITKELILAIFKNEIESSEELTSWLDNLHRQKSDFIDQRPAIESIWQERWDP